MASLYLRAIWQLLRFEFSILRGDFSLLYKQVRDTPQSSAKPLPGLAETICRTIDVVCVWYPKRVLCLQRTAATASLLRQFGLPALMVIGVQTLPFKAHAWVEVDGQVLNDKSYSRDMYTVLDCC